MRVKCCKKRAALKVDADSIGFHREPKKREAKDYHFISRIVYEADMEYPAGQTSLTLMLLILTGKWFGDFQRLEKKKSQLSWTFVASNILYPL